MESQNTANTENSTTQSTKPERQWCNPCRYALNITRSCVTCGNHAHCWCMKTPSLKNKKVIMKACCICVWGLPHECIEKLEATAYLQKLSEQSVPEETLTEYPEDDFQDPICAM